MKNEKKMPKIALGTWSWGVGKAGGNQVFGNYLEAEDLRPVFEEAMKNGLNLIDTAFVYGMGESEKIIGEFIADVSREDVILSTKFTPQFTKEEVEPVRKMLDGSLERLGTDYVDLYWIHNPADVEKWTPYLIPLVKEGKIGKVGVSNHNMEQIKKAEKILSAEGIHLSAVQNHYSLLYRSSEDAGIIDFCREKGIDFFAYMVLEQGALSGKYDSKNPIPGESERAEKYNPMFEHMDGLISEMRSIGSKYGASASQVAISWALSKGVIPLIGMTDKKQVAEAAGAAKLKLTADEYSALEKMAQQTDANTKGYWEKPMVKKI